MARIFKEVRQNKLAKISVGEFLSNVLQIAARYKVRLEPHFATLVVATIILEGIGNCSHFTSSLPSLSLPLFQ
jgi:predicted unusual protein kinase regulating ubiquinone biosynthesis (AarF/ABC1/UbiB family)